MTFHSTVMPAAQRRVLQKLSPFTTEAGFYLAGGTAIAILLGHRRSVDFDWFTRDEIPDVLGLVSDLRQSGIDVAITGVAKGTLHAEIGGVKVSFLEFRYPLLVPPTHWREFGCHLAGLEDLTCMKLNAISQRGAKKDFIDIYAIGRTRFTLEEMLDLYRRKFAIQDVGHTLVSLTFFDDAEEEDPPELLWEVDWEEVKRTVRTWVKEYVGRQEAPGP